MKTNHVRNCHAISRLIVLLFLSLRMVAQDASEADTMKGDVAFSTKKLEEIASQISPKYLFDRDTMILCPEISENKSFVIQYDEKSRISHLGISMFSKEIKELTNEPVCNFVERLLLELSLMADVNAIISMLDHYGILVQKNGQKFGEGNVTSISAILNEIEDPVYFTLSKDEKTYTVAWEYGLQNLFAIQFPLNRELVTGANKLEADNVLFDLLKETHCNALPVHTNYKFDEAELVTNDGTVFIRRGGSFMLGVINESTYYKKAAEGYELIFDEKYPNESLSNLFLGNLENNGLKIQVTHSMYGNYNPEYEMNLNDFICFFKQDFKVYAASYQKESGVINATVVFQNKLYNYINLLIISAKKEDVFNGNGVLTASFRSNIPQHNINSIVKDLVDTSNY